MTSPYSQRFHPLELLLCFQHMEAQTLRPSRSIRQWHRLCSSAETEVGPSMLRALSQSYGCSPGADVRQGPWWPLAPRVLFLPFHGGGVLGTVPGPERTGRDDMPVSNETCRLSMENRKRERESMRRDHRDEVDSHSVSQIGRWGPSSPSLSIPSAHGHLPFLS